jgi:hypothetical protein
MTPRRIVVAASSGVVATGTGVLARGTEPYSALLILVAVLAGLVTVAGGLLAVRNACATAAAMVGVIYVLGQYARVPGFGVSALAAVAVLLVFELGLWAADLGLPARWDRAVVAQRGVDIAGLSLVGLVGAVAVGVAGIAGRGAGVALLIPAILASGVILWLLGRAATGSLRPGGQPPAPPEE